MEIERQDVERAEIYELRGRAEVGHALDKLDTGRYGMCEIGGRPIPIARLRVIPEARYDANHEMEIEHRHGQAFSGPP